MGADENAAGSKKSVFRQSADNAKMFGNKRDASKGNRGGSHTLEGSRFVLCVLMRFDQFGEFLAFRTDVDLFDGTANVAKTEIPIDMPVDGFFSEATFQAGYSVGNVQRLGCIEQFGISVLGAGGLF